MEFLRVHLRSLQPSGTTTISGGVLHLAAGGVLLHPSVGGVLSLLILLLLALAGGDVVQLAVGQVLHPADGWGGATFDSDNYDLLVTEMITVKAW